MKKKGVAIATVATVAVLGVGGYAGYSGFVSHQCLTAQDFQTQARSAFDAEFTQRDLVAQRAQEIAPTQSPEFTTALTSYTQMQEAPSAPESCTSWADAKSITTQARRLDADANTLKALRGTLEKVAANVEHTEATRLFDASRLKLNDLLNAATRVIAKAESSAIAQITIDALNFELETAQQVLSRHTTAGESKKNIDVQIHDFQIAHDNLAKAKDAAEKAIAEKAATHGDANTPQSVTS